MPPFRYKIRKTFKDCLSRQTSEAVAIMLHGGPLLNGKNDYFTNCISRVSVEENEYERKKRELNEAAAEDERLRKLEIFKKEKSSEIKGCKRKKEVSTHQDHTKSEIKKIKFENQETKTTNQKKKLQEKGY